MQLNPRWQRRFGTEERTGREQGELGAVDDRDLLGFSEVSSFSRWFAGVYGAAPSRWTG